MHLIILRVAFVLAAAGIATLLIGMVLEDPNQQVPAFLPYFIFLGTLKSPVPCSRRV